MKKKSHHKKAPRPQSPSLDRTPLTLMIESLSPQAQGVALHGDKKHLVPFTLPGETVRVLPVAQKKNTVFCELIKVIKKSPKRITPKCPHFGTCGGCDLQHLSYEDQLTFKQTWIETLIVQKCRSVEVFKLLPSPRQFNYRNRITLHTDGKTTGYFKPFSHEIVPIKKCALAEENARVLIKHTTSNPAVSHQFSELKHFNTSTLQHTFTQVNASQNTNLIKTVLSFCSGRKWKSALELYCGAGNLTFDLAGLCKKIIAVDLDAEAIRLANVQRHEEKKTNIKFMAASAHNAVFQHAQALEQFDLIVCDPPREGLRETAKLIPRLKPKQIVYVSCDPQAFLNDLKVLEGFGYTLTDVAPIDMFPQTYHVEVVGRLKF